MAMQLSAKLDRSDTSTPWGFRLHGGRDYHAPLTIQRVTPGSLAAKCGLQVGDILIRIGDSPTEAMAHKDAQNLILHSGNSLELAIQRGQAQFKNPVAHTPQPAFSPAQQPYSTPAQPSPSYGSYQSNQNYQPQDYNRAAQPFAPSSGSYSPGGASVPVARNMQYNTPINLYSVDNVVDSLASQTGALSINAPHQSEPIPPWQSQVGGHSPGRSHGMSHTSMPSGNASPWRPKIPTGPRKMRAGARGSAKSMTSAMGGRVPMCSACGTTIRGPFVSAMEKDWCPDHFNCSNPNCRSPLIDMGFVEEEGQLFCERDYEQFFAPRCGKCGRAIIRECVNALKDTFHPECFLCSKCHCQLGQGAFHMEDGKAFCERDWQAMFQTKCYGCQFPIEPGDRWVEALNENWHSECFNCSTCQVNLEGQSFYAKQGKPYCKKHASERRF